MSSNLLIFQISVVVLLMVTFAMTDDAPQPTSLLAEMSQAYDDERNPLGHSSSADSFSAEDHQKYYLKTLWPHLLNKRYASKVIRAGVSTGGDSRLWALPYRFGKRSAMPYRFGKRNDMHIRFDK